MTKGQFSLAEACVAERERYMKRQRRAWDFEDELAVGKIAVRKRYENDEIMMPSFDAMFDLEYRAMDRKRSRANAKWFKAVLTGVQQVLEFEYERELRLGDNVRVKVRDMTRIELDAWEEIAYQTSRRNNRAYELKRVVARVFRNRLNEGESIGTKFKEGNLELTDKEVQWFKDAGAITDQDLQESEVE